MSVRRFFARLLGRGEAPAAPIPEAEARDYTRAELAEFDGTDPSRPLLIAIKGHVYDVTRGRDFYGPGGPYASFAGKDCTRALAKVSFDPEDFTSNFEGLDADELAKLDEWIEMFEGKYRRLGRLVDATAPC